ncbi:hypothetical protein AJ79_09092 [Helicocarpus griseus UAMH5409]|uniref:Major facilitator superfamily (MFS) profile domain-containing protein n=1 Tax=Helicocarpus griseus UAMH5409 TaxID=1447875 RepID=A0A2B7WMA9_9EURO|nr:hypothetical protein AJ79_09092 [Helicocarpus griseus UAMH5409]
MSAITASQDAEVKKGDESVAVEEVPVLKPVSKFTRRFRSPLFNVIIVGLISFTQPGIWNALNYTGAGGQQEPYLVNGANSLTFGLMAFGCTIFGVLATRYGLRRVLIFGTLGYAPYSASLYVNNRYGTEWFVLFGGVTCGLAASALWAAEGAIAIAYPTVKDRGKMTGIWLGLRELGQLIGASISLSLNVKGDGKGKVGYVTYIVLIAIQCLGLPLALLVSPPQKVIRPDGTKVNGPSREKTIAGEFRGALKVLKTKHIYLLIPMLVGFGWNVSYLGIYQTAYFSVRSRTLASLCSGIVSTFANIFWGWFFDLKCFSRPVLAKSTWFFFAAFMFSLFAWQVANEKLYSSAVSKVTLDWAGPGFGRGFAVNILFRFMNESHYMFVYWIIGTFTDNLDNITLTVGIIRSFESVGSAISYGIGAAKTTPMVNLIVSFVMFGLTVLPTTAVVFMVPEHPSDDPLIADDARANGGNDSTTSEDQTVSPNKEETRA